MAKSSAEPTLAETDFATTQSRHSLRLALFAVLAGSLTGPLATSAVNVGLPVLAAEFGLGVSSAQWVTSSFMTGVVSLLLVLGRLSDLLGHRRVFLLGSAISFLASLLSGLAPSFEILIAGRVLQAIGAGMLMVAPPALLTTLFPPNERGKIIGIYVMVVAVGLTTGPAVGGFLTDLFGWRAMFFLGLPVAALPLILGYFWIHVEHAKPAVREPFDITGTVLWAIALTSLVTVITQGGVWGWNSRSTLGIGLVGLVAILLFIAVQRRVPSPIFPFELFSNRMFASSVAASLCGYMSQYTAVLLAPFYLINVLGVSASEAGAIVLALTVPVPFVAPLSGSLSDRVGTRIPATVGMMFCATGSFLLAGLGADASAWDVMWRLFVYGIGYGVFQSPNNNALMSSVPPSRLGMGGAMMGTVRNFGMLMGIALGSAVFTGLYHRGLLREGLDLATTTVAVGPYLAALRGAFLMAATVATIGIAAAWWRGNDAPSRVAAEQDAA